MSYWRQKGWLVNSFNAPKPNPDGTQTRLVQLSIPKSGNTGKPASKNAQPLQYRTVEYVERPGTNLSEAMVFWREEGWTVSSFSGPLPQSDGTSVRMVELSKPWPPKAGTPPPKSAPSVEEAPELSNVVETPTTAPEATAAEMAPFL